MNEDIEMLEDRESDLHSLDTDYTDGLDSTTDIAKMLERERLGKRLKKSRNQIIGHCRPSTVDC